MRRLRQQIGQDLSVRIVSLLPSATEIVYLLGLEHALVGVTHECDWPRAAQTKPCVSFSNLPSDASAADIDRLVSAAAAGGLPTLGLDHDALRQLRPDLLLTQDLCAVCAIPRGDLRVALDRLGLDAAVVSLDPSSLDDVFDGIVAVGVATGSRARAADVVGGLRRRLEEVRDAVRGSARPRTLALEWADPPFSGGHWIPEMIEVAGGEPILASPRSPSVRLSWDEIAAARPELVIFMPCGYDLQAAIRGAAPLLERDELRDVHALFAADGNAFFSRPGPRLVDGVEALAGVLRAAGAAHPTGTVIRRMR
jgi:iron complex transport system substrate-binding protein